MFRAQGHIGSGVLIIPPINRLRSFPNVFLVVQVRSYAHMQ
jgi:hypothetical protein